jgi:hypothetical protein
MLDRTFELENRATTVRTEILAWRYDFHDDGVHHIRESSDPRRCRHGPGRGLHGDLCRICLWLHLYGIYANYRSRSPLAWV